MEKFRASGWKQLNQKDYRDHSEVIKKEVAKLNRGKKYESESQYINLVNLKEELLKQADLIDCLRIEGVKDLHFQEISNEMKIPISCDVKNMETREVLMLLREPLMSEKEDFIREIADKAKNQEQLEKEILKIESTWKEFSMNIIPKGGRDDGKIV